MVKHSCLYLLLFFCSKMTAQYTDIINSNRPGFSESPFAVGTGIVQIEGGFVHQSFENKAGNQRLAINQWQQIVRMSAFSERFEWNAFAFQDHNYFYLDDFKQRRAGASIGLGMKYLLYLHDYKKPREIRSWKKRQAFDWKRLIPSVGIAASASFYAAPSLTSKLPNLDKDLLFPNTSLFSFTNTNTLVRTRKGPYLGRIALLLQNDLHENWVVTTNFVFNKTYERTDQYSFAVSSNYILTERWAIFGETRQVVQPEYTAEFAVGTAFLANQNLQFDAAMHGGTSEFGRSTGFSIGASYRFDNHTDRYKIIEIDAAGNKIVPPEENTKKIPFLKRTGQFFKTIPQKTKELVTVGIISTGDFFRNLFSKKTKKKKRKKRALKKPKRGFNLQKEQTERDLLQQDKTTKTNSETKVNTSQNE